MELQAQENTPVEQPEIRSIHPAGHSIELILSANRAVIDSPETQAMGATLAKMLNAEKKRLNTERDELVGNINKAATAARDLFKSQIEPIEAAKDQVLDKMTVYQQEQDRIAREEAEAIRKEQEELALAEAQRLEAAGDTVGAEEVLEEAADAPQQPVVEQGPVHDEYGNVGYMRQGAWKYEVENVSLIPQEFLMPDDRAIKAVIVEDVAAMKGGTIKKPRNIPGLKIYQEEAKTVVR